MATVYKALARADDAKKPNVNGVAKENRQRILILSSRGVTFRY